MKILAIDPGKYAGWALRDSEKSILSTGTMIGNDVHVVKKMVSDLLPDLILIEDQHQGRANPQSMKEVYSCRYFFEAIGRVFQAKIEIITPKAWQSYFNLHRKPYERDSKWKNRLRQFAIIKHELLFAHNECDAVLILDYWMETNE